MKGWKCLRNYLKMKQSDTQGKSLTLQAQLSALASAAKRAGNGGREVRRRAHLPAVAGGVPTLSTGSASKALSPRCTWNQSQPHTVLYGWEPLHRSIVFQEESRSVSSLSWEQLVSVEAEAQYMSCACSLYLHWQKLLTVLHRACSDLTLRGFWWGLRNKRDPFAQALELATQLERDSLEATEQLPILERLVVAFSEAKSLVRHSLATSGGESLL